MKNIILILSSLILINERIVAQAPNTIICSGIYKTPQDFKEGKLSFRANCDSFSGTIKLHHFFSGKYVDVIDADKKYRFNKDSIFGYRTCKGSNYRFYKAYNSEYQVKEVNGMVIYSVLAADQSYSGKGLKMIYTYFFSKTLSSDILPLTIANVKKVFADNNTFCNVLNSVGDISAYDDIHKMYSVNYILIQSTNTNKQTP